MKQPIKNSRFFLSSHLKLCDVQYILSLGYVVLHWNSECVSRVEIVCIYISQPLIIHEHNAKEVNTAPLP